ncbi:MFS transporter [Arthrobacter sunyaminii]|uniref:MFS transporter n=1 Tax=Arthrobacter sunyaminii TaxID=2816859 RepID=A0A975S6T3_9MICC|nr:MFS transporter [Arthrobacter sunyaminii]MBO0907827.1 MFS transporter [Arthrobacter sunyaminii]QWQ36884.1 MFS transporter [Arthrobacter sunyaminii]
MATPASGPARQGHPFAALRHRGFALFFSGALVSNTGTWLGNLTVPYVLYQNTGSAVWVGFAAAAQFGPALLLSPLGGLLADSLDRRLLLLWTQVAMGGVAVAMWMQWASGLHSPVLLIGLLTLFGIFNGLNNPAWQSLVNDLVPRRDVLSAVTLNSLQFNLARAVGPALAGVLLATMGATWAFFFNAVSFAVVVVTLLFVRPCRTVVKPAHRQGFAAQWRQAGSHLASSRPLLLAVALCCLAGMLSNPIFSLTVVFAETVYFTDTVGLGLLTAALGAGSVVYALTGLLAGGRRPDFARRAVLGITGLGIGHMLLSVLPGLGWGLASAVLIGAAFLAVMSTLNSVIQLLAPDRLRGRILAVRHMAFSTSVAAGSLAAGYLTDAVGVQTTCLLIGVVLLLAGAALLCLPRVTALLDRAAAGEKESPGPNSIR